MSRRSLIGAVLTAVTLHAAPAVAEPPANDHPAGAAVFQPFTAASGVPTEQQAVAELAEATADGGVPRCLGPSSFDRTVWYRVPEAIGPQELKVEASGSTLDVLDVAAFVQPEVPVPPPAPTPTPTPVPPEPAPTPVTSQFETQTVEPNQCAGAGVGGADAAEEPTTGLTLRVPARYPVLIQVGRRGPRSSPDHERAILSLAATVLEDVGTPRGDRATRSVPRARNTGTVSVPLAGATLSDEDPAQPACPSYGSVWRQFRPREKGKRLIRLTGGSATTLTVFRGTRPTADNVLDCVNREGSGALEMVVPVKRRRTTWIRIGTDRPGQFASAGLTVAEGRRATVIDGGPGGSDPTAGGPGGGFPTTCDRADPREARLSGPRLAGTAASRNAFTRVPVTLRIRGSSVCDAELRLYGPRNRIYAKGRAGRLLGRETVRLPRQLTFRKGRYRLEVRGVDYFGRRFTIRGRVKGRLR